MLKQFSLPCIAAPRPTALRQNSGPLQARERNCNLKMAARKLPQTFKRSQTKLIVSFARGPACDHSSAVKLSSFLKAIGSIADNELIGHLPAFRVFRAYFLTECVDHRSDGDYASLAELRYGSVLLPASEKSYWLRTVLSSVASPNPTRAR